MTARLVAAVALRMAGAWLVLRSLYGVAALLWLAHSISPTAHIAWWKGALTSAGVDTRLHDTYYVITHRPIPMMFYLILGLICIFAAGPLSRLLAWKLDDVR